MADELGEKSESQIYLENIRKPSDAELELTGKVYKDFYKWRARRSGTFKQFQDYTFEDYLTISRELFWNAVNAPSQDLAELGINVAIPYIRKELLDFLGRMTALNIKPRLVGDELNNFGMRFFNGIYKKWRFKSNQNNEKFWQLLYGMMNGTLICFMGYNDAKFNAKFIKGYNKDTGDFRVEEKEIFLWNDVWEEVVPIEDIYVPYLEERDIQKQGKLIHRTQMPWKDFKEQFNKFKNAEYVYPGNRIAEDSLYYRLLAGSGITTVDRVEVLKYWDALEDRYIIMANGVWLNPMKGEKAAPMPFNHKKLPFIKSINKPLDEKFFYGLSTPFDQKDAHKIANTLNSVMLEREIRVISPPILTSDIEAPDLIYGDNQVIPVNDITAYKELEVQDLSQQSFALKQGMENIISSNIQGGSIGMPASKQPRSAKEMMQLEALKQQAMGNAMVMYRDLLRQEILLMIKTALQFYEGDKYKKQKKNVIKSLMVPDSPLLMGGMGNLELRIVKKSSSKLNLFMEMMQKSFENQKMTEIIEAPIDLIRDLEFEVTDVELESERTSEMEQALFVEKIMNPMAPFVQMGLVDPTKLFLRWMEKMGEHPSDYVSDKVMPQMMATWQGQYQFPTQNFGMNNKQGMGNQQGNLNQSNRGIQNGGSGNQGMGGGMPQFGSQNSQPVSAAMPGGM